MCNSVCVLKFYAIARIMLPFLVAVLAGIILILLPQRLQVDRQKRLRALICIGARVKTGHGYVGTITHHTNNLLILDLDDGRKVEVLTESVIKVEHA